MSANIGKAKAVGGADIEHLIQQQVVENCRGRYFRLVQPFLKGPAGALQAIVHQGSQVERPLDAQTRRAPFEQLESPVNAIHQPGDDDERQYRTILAQSRHGPGLLQGGIDHNDQNQTAEKGCGNRVDGKPLFVDQTVWR
ncbi:hypothetical protein [Desulfosarcina cetonica]|uniref:hypothetical protein n=1 Tax=Desulfosarcina cetonica TaxID=90730 RepID=UPI0006D09DC3|nr:hypothetical protein [Desulfosarcina cetonica]